MKVARVFGHWCSRRKIALYALEQGGMALAFAAVFMTVARPHVPLGAWILLAAAAGFVFQASFYFADLYDLRAALSDRARGARLLWGLGVAAALCTPLALIGSRAVAPGVVLAALAAAIAIAVGSRLALPRLVGPPEPVLVVGNGPRARAFARAVDESGEGGFHVVGFLDPAPGGAELRPEGDVDAAAARLGAKIVVVALEEGQPPPARALLRCRLDGIEVLDATGFSERVLRRLPVTHLRAEELIYSEGFFAGRVDAFFKRALDVAASATLAVLASPLMLLSAAVIRLDSKGPVFYEQERVGKGGRIFRLIKFRTMRTDAEADGRPVWAKEKDDRVTRVGRFLRKTRMDELPQIISVLRGDMSFVGPRPERPFFVEKIKEEVPFYELREAIKPGITGWAQLRYPYGASVEDARAKLEYDLYYLKNRSLFLDLAIIFHTARHVLMGRGAR